MTDLDVKIRQLVGEYGYGLVYNALDKEMKESYKFLHGLNGSEKKNWLVDSGVGEELVEVGEDRKKVVAEVSGVRTTEVSGNRKEAEVSGNRKEAEVSGVRITEVSGNRKESEIEETSIRVQKTEDNNHISSSSGDSEDEKIFFSNGGSEGKKKGVMRAIMKKKVTGQAVQSVVESVVKSEVETNNYVDKPKFDKQEHITAIEKKYAELKGKGINPESLLSKENLEKWLNEGMSYMRISREKVGLADKIVSEYAKKYNLKSTITKLKEQKKNSS